MSSRVTVLGRQRGFGQVLRRLQEVGEEQRDIYPLDEYLDTSLVGLAMKVHDPSPKPNYLSMVSAFAGAPVYGHAATEQASEGIKKTTTGVFVGRPDKAGAYIVLHQTYDPKRRNHLHRLEAEIGWPGHPSLVVADGHEVELASEHKRTPMGISELAPPLRAAGIMGSAVASLLVDITFLEYANLFVQ